MHKTSFNKKGEQAICLYCKQTPVDPDRWDKKCANCKAENSEEDPEAGLAVDQRRAAAIWEDEQGHQILVDKFGREVDNPGYDTKADPRGWRYTGTKPKEVEII